MRITHEEIEKQYEYMHRVRAITADGARAYIQTFGCQQNEADSERLGGMLCEMGYTIVYDAKDADLVLVNTCAVREHAELKALSITGQFKHMKEENPDLLIGICGCMVTQDHRVGVIKNSYPYVDFLFGTAMVYRFPEILYGVLTEHKRQFWNDPASEGHIAEGLPVKREGDFKAWLSVMYGCNNFCSYCVVPYVRGRERSREKEDVLAEARELAASGVKEITLLGQNVNSYGKDLGYDYDFADLLSDICKIDGDFRLRFMTSHPKDASHKLIDVMAREPKIEKHFHLPLQSGDDRILKVMNRKYDRSSYLALVDYMRQKMPEIAITTDIIVGFPGESEEEFQNTLDVLSRVRFDNIYSFIYSKRKGTPAAEMEDQIPEEVKKERMSRLLDLQGEISKQKNGELVGHSIEVLVEGESKTDPDRLTGRTAGNKLVHFTGDTSLIGKRIDLKILSAHAYSLIGEQEN